jgi:lipopolysaccharide/colanic/teichoic acid biosynthesis glycosyltransferase
VVIAAAALTITAPILAVAAIAIRLKMGRPILFRHARAGRDGEPFELLKLRSMRPMREGETAPDADGARITPLGRFLRSTSIDELPSLVNVLRGDMAVVGPRPLPVRYLDRYTDRQRRRLDVRPGITGWAQINGRNAIGWDARLELDAWYVDHRSLALDARILAGTIPVVVRRSGISGAGHATMAQLPPARHE